MASSSIEKLEVGPTCIRGVDGIHLGGNLLAHLASGLPADHINRLATRDLIQPRGNDGAGRETARVTGEFEEGGLGDFLGQMRRADLAERRRMDEVQMATDDFRESVLGVLPGIAGGRRSMSVSRMFGEYNCRRCSQSDKISFHDAEEVGLEFSHAKVAKGGRSGTLHLVRSLFSSGGSLLVKDDIYARGFRTVATVRKRRLE